MIHLNPTGEALDINEYFQNWLYTLHEVRSGYFYQSVVMKENDIFHQEIRCRNTDTAMGANGSI